MVRGELAQKRKRAKVKLKKRDAGRWLQQEYSKKKRWVTFAFSFDRLQYIYNLRPDVLEKIRNEYLTGKKADQSEKGPLPKTTNQMQQGMIAADLMLGLGLSISEFCAVKRLATARNQGKVSVFDGRERSKWPARPDIFANCPSADLNAVSDDEIEEYYIHDKYASDLESDIADWSETQDSVDFLNCNPSSSPFVQPFNSSHEFNGLEGSLQEMRTEPDNDPIRPHSQAADQENQDLRKLRGSIALLKDLALTFDGWGRTDSTQKRYGISRSKSFDVRRAVKELHDGEIEGVSWEDFLNACENKDLISMPLQADKRASIKQVVSLHKSTESTAN